MRRQCAQPIQIEPRLSAIRTAGHHAENNQFQPFSRHMPFSPCLTLRRLVCRATADKTVSTLSMYLLTEKFSATHSRPAPPSRWRRDESSATPHDRALQRDRILRRNQNPRLLIQHHLRRPGGVARNHRTGARHRFQIHISRPRLINTGPSKQIAPREMLRQIRVMQRIA